MKYWRHSVILWIILLGCGVNNADESVPDALKTMTGSQTRVVWVQEQGNGADPFAFGRNLKLVGYDTNDGRGERYLAERTANYFKPLLTPDGQKVVYTDITTRHVFVTDWNSASTQDLGTGVAIEVWKDAQTETVWVYVFDGPQPENFYFTTQPLYRFPLAHPKQRESVWNKTPMNWHNFQLSADGQRAGGLFPWPHAGILNTQTGEWKRYGRGCWTSLSPDNSYILWLFDEPHRNLILFSGLETKEDGRTQWQVNINSAPGINGFEIYHPRWSNHVRYIAITGPYVEGEGSNKIMAGGRKVEIHVGKFDSDFKRIEQWVKVSDNNKGDFYPDVWVKR
jgi:hypothetical protein